MALCSICFALITDHNIGSAMCDTHIPCVYSWINTELERSRQVIALKR